MRIAARWFGWCSLLIAAVGLVGTIARHDTAKKQPSDASSLSNVHNVYREFWISKFDDEAALQACFNRYSGLVYVKRDDDERAVTIFVEADGPLADCFDEARLRTPILPLVFTGTPPTAYFHQRLEDPWAPSSEPDLFPSVLFPPRWYRCDGIAPQRGVLESQIRKIEKSAEGCVDPNGSNEVDALVGSDGHIIKLSLQHAEPPERIACLVETVCQYRFSDRVDYPDQIVPLLVMSPRARRLAAPVLKDPSP